MEQVLSFHHLDQIRHGEAYVVPYLSICNEELPKRAFIIWILRDEAEVNYSYDRSVPQGSCDSFLLVECYDVACVENVLVFHEL